MASSDIIKIGFDYRSSLAQFEKDTNGVFDGISSKAGKQKITIQLDAKDDKVIDKIKELQKLKLDKFTFEFGNSGLKEQLQTFDKLENKINEIINLSRGIGNSSTSIIDVNKSSNGIDKLESKLSELSKKYEELQKGNISGKDISLVDNDEFKKLSESFEKIKGEVDDLKTHMSLLDDNTISGESFVKLSSQVDGLSTKLDDLLGKYDKLAVAQKNLGAETNISSGLKDAFQGDVDTSSSVKSLENLEKEIKKIFTDTNELRQILDSLHNGKYFNLSWTTDGIDATGADERVRQLSKLLKEYGYTIDNLKSDSDAFDTSGVINAIKEENNILEQNTQKAKENAEAKEKMANADKEVSNTNFSKYDNRLESYNKKTSGYDATIARFEDGGWTSDVYLKNVQAVKDAVAEYEKILNNLKSHPELVTEKELNKLDEQEKLIKENITAVQNMSAAEKGFTLLSGQKAMDKINSILKENSAMSKQAKNQIRAWYNEIASRNPSKNLSQILGEVQKIVNAEAEAGRAGKSMWDIFKDKSLYGGIARLAQYYLSFTDIIRYGRQAISTIVELDDALVDLKKTTSMSSSELENFYYDANDVAKQMGVTTAEIINQASAWSRLSYSSKEASTEMAKLSSQFASISPGMDTTTAQEDLVSIMRAYDIDPDDVKSQIMDKINVLGRQFIAQTYSNVWHTICM